MKRIILVVAGLAVAGIAGACYWPGSRGTDVLRLPGTVEVQEVRLGSKVGGRVAAVHVRESEVVEPGQMLVTFETAELAARRDQARARLDAARAAMDRATRGPRDEEVAEAKGTAEAARARYERTTTGFREEQKAQARHELAAAVADFRQAEQEYARLSDLYATGAGSRSDIDLATAGRDRGRNRVKVAEAALELLVRGNRVEDVAEAKADLDRFNARHELLKNGTRAEDKAAAYAAVGETEAQLAEAEANLREAVVTAPERCRVEVLSVRPGDLVPAGQPAVRAQRAGDLWVKVFVPSTDLGKLRLGQGVEVAVDSHPGRRFAGEVVHIAAVSEFTPRNVQSIDERRHQVFAVKVRVTDPDGVFKSGMAAEVFAPLAEVSR